MSSIIQYRQHTLSVTSNFLKGYEKNQLVSPAVLLISPSINELIRFINKLLSEPVLSTTRLAYTVGNIQQVSYVWNSTFRCLAFSFPSVPKTQQALYTRSPERSGMEPPTIVILRRRETSDSMAVEGDASPPASMSSA